MIPILVSDFLSFSIFFFHRASKRDIGVVFYGSRCNDQNLILLFPFRRSCFLYCDTLLDVKKSGFLTILDLFPLKFADV